MDVHSPEKRSYNMSRIKGKDTKPELLLRQWLWQNGYRYRLHKKNLPGKPDIVLPKWQKAIFVHGCFWHRHKCKYFQWPDSNFDFWKKKIEENVKRDEANYTALDGMGWQYLIIWECELRCKDLASLWLKTKKFLDNRI